MGHPILLWKKILNLCISSGARMIYVYLSSLFYKLLAILQSQIKLDKFISPLIWERHLEPHPKHAETMKIRFRGMSKSLYVCF